MSETEYPDYAKDLPAGHPVKVYLDENRYLVGILTELGAVDAQADFQRFFNLFNQLCEVEKRYARKENQLFPYLEKHGWTGPSQGMWSFHDSNRDLLGHVRKKIEQKKYSTINHEISVITDEMLRLVQVEEARLLPYALELLDEEDWKEMKEGDVEIGWMFKQPPLLWPYDEDDEEGEAPKDKREARLAAVKNKRFKMNEGLMTLEQINLMLKFMPVDLTYVDENDQVVFYNRGEDRVFPRSAGIIGREVRFCHPPKSVDTVLRILEEFKSGTKDDAEFWVRFKGRVIHIRYFAIRDPENNYKGVIEMSQDITEIQKLEGEQRLLDWD